MVPLGVMAALAMMVALGVMVLGFGRHLCKLRSRWKRRIWTDLLLVFVELGHSLMDLASPAPHFMAALAVGFGGKQVRQIKRPLNLT